MRSFYNEMTHAATMPFIMVMLSENTFIASNMPVAMPPGFPNMPFVMDGLCHIPGQRVKVYVVY